MSGLWNTTRNCPQCDATRPPPQRTPGKGKGKGKSFAERNALRTKGKAKGKGKQPSKWEDGPGAAADPPPPKPPGKGVDDKALKEARDENAQLRAQLAQLNEQQQAPQQEAAASAPQTVSYSGEQVTLGQLYAIYRGMGFLPPEHPNKRQVHELIRQLQKQKGDAVEPEERCAHLEQIITRLHSKLEDLTEKHEALEHEQDALTKKITASQVEVDEIRQQIADAKDDKREA